MNGLDMAIDLCLFEQVLYKTTNNYNSDLVKYLVVLSEPFDDDGFFIIDYFERYIQDWGHFQ